MTNPPPQKPAIPVAPLTGADWWAARAAMAARRSRRFMVRWLLVTGPLALIAVAVPLASRDPAAGERTARAQLVADTIRTSDRLQAAVRNASAAESSVIEATIPLAGSGAERPVARPRPPVAAATTPAPGMDPALAALSSAISEARRLRTPAAWITLSNAPPVSDGPRMRALADSLTRLTQQRDALPSGPSRDRLAAPLTARINRLGYTIVAIAEYRQRQMAAEAGVVPPVERPTPPEPEAEPVATGTVADTAALRTLALAAQDSLVQAQRAHGAAVDVLRSTESAVGTARNPWAAATPALAMLLVLVGGLVVRFTSALSRETSAPTVASALEAERAIGVPVLATVTEAPPEGGARFRPGGVDPFRMLYLGLTSTGTRARTTIVTGRDPTIVAAVAARLAVSAAADHRTTLLMDVDPVSIALSRTFRERAEPGLTDALAGAFTWREVARPVGSSDGLSITIVPAGTERDDLPTGDVLAAAREDLTRFRAPFEFTILVVPLDRLELARALVEASPLVLSASVGATAVDRFTKDGAALKASGEQRVHGTVLWDAPPPELPSRAELAALLSKQKNRTPGGSFAAVKKAISGDKKSQ